MRADGVSEEMIARFVAEEMEEDEFRRGKGVTEIEALRERRRIPEHIRSSRPATRCACAAAACSLRVAARNAGLRSPGCAINRPRNPAGDRRLPDERRSREPRRPQPLGQSL